MSIFLQICFFVLVFKFFTEIYIRPQISLTCTNVLVLVPLFETQIVEEILTVLVSSSTCEFKYLLTVSLSPWQSLKMLIRHQPRNIFIKFLLSDIFTNQSQLKISDEREQGHSCKIIRSNVLAVKRRCSLI